MWDIKKSYIKKHNFLLLCRKPRVQRTVPAKLIIIEQDIKLLVPQNPKNELVRTINGEKILYVLSLIVDVYWSYSSAHGNATCTDPVQWQQVLIMDQ